MTGVPGNATVLDATVLSNFAHVDAVELLLDLPRVVTVDEVATELERGRDTHSYLDHAIAVLDEGIPVVAPTESVQTIEQELLETLDPGEAQAVAVAEAVDGTVVTDDGDAKRLRTIAESVRRGRSACWCDSSRTAGSRRRRETRI